MNRKNSNEFVFSLIALAICVAIVHSIYVLHVRPTAQAILVEQRAAAARDPRMCRNAAFT